MYSKKLCFVLFMVFVVSQSVFAQSVPPLVNYQGKLTDATGADLATGEYDLYFRIWNDPAAENTTTNLVWGEKHVKVPVVRGMFNVILGGGTPLSGLTDAQKDITKAFNGSVRYVGIAFNNSALSAEIKPRQQILSAPYAMSAQNAQNAQNANESVHTLNADHALTAGKVNGSANIVYSSGITVQTITTTNTPAGLKASISVKGERPVLVQLAPLSGGWSSLKLSNDGGVYITLSRDSTIIGKWYYYNNAPNDEGPYYLPASAISFLDTTLPVGDASYEYSLTFLSKDCSVNIEYCRLVVMEL